MLIAVSVFGSTLGAAAAVDGVDGTTLRPRQVDARVKGCKVAEPGDYEVAVGALIELDCTYPVTPPAIPKKVDYNITNLGVVIRSQLGFRTVRTPRRVGTDTIAFYFDANREGTEAVTLIVDGVEYDYKIKVRK
jgi:hypothetical protein